MNSFSQLTIFSQNKKRLLFHKKNDQEKGDIFYCYLTIDYKTSDKSGRTW